MGGGCGAESTSANDEAKNACVLLPEGDGGGRGAEVSEKGEPKKACVLLPVGEGGGEEVVFVSTLRWEERVEEQAEGEGLRW